MKPYRGMILASAVLLATLPFSGCGDSDTWEESSGITLSAPVATGLNETVFTVETPLPEEGYACDMILQYRAEGAGVSIFWANIPGTETTRVFKVRPRREGIMSVIARGMCDDSKEDWEYSNRIDVTVTAVPAVVPTPPTVSALTLTASPSTVVVDPLDDTDIVTFDLTVASPVGCTLNLTFEHSGAGLPPSGPVPASQGLIPLNPSAVGTLVGKATAWCSENPGVTVTASASATVTAAPAPAP